jgi:hypothetical protein
MEGKEERESRCLHEAAERMTRQCRHVVEDILLGWEVAEVEREFREIIVRGLKQFRGENHG